MSLFRGERPALGPFTVQADGTAAPITILNADGTVNGTIGLVTGTFASAAPTNIRAIDLEPVLSAASIAISGSVAGLRGNITLNAGSTITAGYEYGVQGKLTLKGTLVNGSGFNAGIFGQVDTSASSFVHTSGYLAPIMGDFGATSIMASDANANMVSLLNTTNCIINSAVQFIGNATYAFDLSDLAYGGAHFIVATAKGSGWDKSLKINLNGTTYYIPCNSAAS